MKSKDKDRDKEVAYIDYRQAFNNLEETFESIRQDVKDDILGDLLIARKVKDTAKGRVFYQLWGESHPISMIGLLEYLKMLLYDNMEDEE